MRARTRPRLDFRLPAAAIRARQVRYATSAVRGGPPRIVVLHALYLVYGSSDEANTEQTRKPGYLSIPDASQQRISTSQEKADKMRPIRQTVLTTRQDPAPEWCME